MASNGYGKARRNSDEFDDAGQGENRGTTGSSVIVPFTAMEGDPPFPELDQTLVDDLEDELTPKRRKQILDRKSIGPYGAIVGATNVPLQIESVNKNPTLPTTIPQGVSVGRFFSNVVLLKFKLLNLNRK